MELFFMLIDRMIQLLSTGEKRRAAALAELAWPLFFEFEQVAKHSMSTFQVARKLAMEEDFSTGVDTVREMREETLLARIKIRALIQPYRERFVDPTFGELADSMLAFFSSSVACLFLSDEEGSDLRTLCDLFEYIENGRFGTLDCSSVLAAEDLEGFTIFERTRSTVEKWPGNSSNVTTRITWALSLQEDGGGSPEHTKELVNDGQLVSEAAAREFLVAFINHSLAQMEKNWALAVGHYANLRAMKHSRAMILRPRPIRKNLPPIAPPKIPYGPNCPFCGKELRTKTARQCRHCKKDWHDEENIKELGT